MSCRHSFLVTVFSIEISVSTQYRPGLDVANCGILIGFALFAEYPKMGIKSIKD